MEAWNSLQVQESLVLAISMLRQQAAVRFGLNEVESAPAESHHTGTQQQSHQ